MTDFRTEVDFEQLVRISTDLISVHEMDGTYTYASPASFALLGYRPEELVGQNAFLFFHPDDLAKMRDVQKTVATVSDVVTARYRIRRKDGTYRWFESTNHMIRDDNGEPIEIFSAKRDVTTTVEQELRLQEAEERFRLAFENAPIGIAIVDLDGRWVKVNQAVLDIVGYPEDQLLKLTFQDITHPHDLESDLRQVEQLVAGDIKTYQMEKRYITATGGVVWVTLSVSLVRDSNDKPMHFIAQIEDISERKRAQEVRDAAINRLMELDEVKNSFVGMVAHDLRSPLTIITGFSSMLGDQWDRHDETAKQNMVEAIRRTAGRMAELIDDVLSVSRMESGAMSVESTVFDPFELIERSVEDQRASLGREIIFDRPNEPSAVLADNAATWRIITNLVSNAVKFSDEPVTVRATCNKAMVQIDVSDKGPGIAPEDFDKLFKRFSRIDQADGSHVAGTGLGLFISAQLVELQGGEIWATSELGVGTTMSFTLPAADASPKLATL